MTATTELDAKLEDVARQYDALTEELARPETSTDPDLIRRLGRELARVEPVVDAYRPLSDSCRPVFDACRPVGDAYRHV